MAEEYITKIVEVDELEKDKEQSYKDEITRLKKLLREQYREQNLAEEIREKAFNLSRQSPKPPEWISEDSGNKNPGTPTLFLSDWHWAEVVDPSEISGKNQYNLDIANQRAQLCFDRFIEFYHKHVSLPKYPGCVIALGGDMVSGTIHDELKETNEIDIMPTVMDLSEVLIAGIKKLLLHFPKIAAFCVTGNHGRYTQNKRFKRRAYTSFDWLLYCMVEKYFQHDERVKFVVQTGPDDMYKIHNTTYLLSHGDMLGRGGDGIIGMLGPVTRGDHRRRTRQMGLGDPYDVLICGHWHQLAMLRSRIVNGSLKGYDEFAYTLGFQPEPPMQASWLTHPKHGITMQIPIFCDKIPHVEHYSPAKWVSWAKI